jgi:hypothetical protein
VCSASDQGFFTADACRPWRLRLGPPGRAGRPAKAIFRRGAGSVGARASPLGVPACARAVRSAGRYLQLYTYPYGILPDVKTNLAVWVFPSSTLLTYELVPGFARQPPAHKHFSLQARVQACPKPDGVHDLEQRRSLPEEFAADRTMEACIHSPCQHPFMHNVPGVARRASTTACLAREHRCASKREGALSRERSGAPTQQHGHINQEPFSEESATCEINKSKSPWVR